MASESTTADTVSCGSESVVLSASQEFVTVELSSCHQVDNFSCARDSDAAKYIKEDISHLINQRCGAAFVIENPNSDEGFIWGYYHLVGSSLRRSEFSNREQKVIPVGTTVPVFTIAWVARCDTAPKKIGKVLIVDAARRAYAQFPNWGMTLYANNPNLVKYYELLGFKVVRSVRQEQEKNNGVLLGSGPFLMYAPYSSLILPRKASE